MKTEYVGRVLIVDDEPFNLRLMSDVVGHCGHDAVPLQSGQEALTRLEEETFDLVLLDLMMPGVSGMDVLEVLREAGKVPSLPVLMITAVNETAVREKALKLGAIDFLTKPTNLTELSCKVNTLVELAYHRKSSIAEAKESSRQMAFHHIQNAIRGLPLILYEYRLDVPLENQTSGIQGAWVIGRVQEIIGCSEQAFLASTDWLEHIHPEEQPLLSGLWMEALEGKRQAFGARFRLLVDNEYHWRKLAVVVDEKYSFVRGAILDIDIEMSNEAKLQQIDNVKTLGRLAGDFARDFSNQLAVISSYSSLLEETTLGSAYPDEFSKLQDATEKAAELTQRLSVIHHSSQSLETMQLEPALGGSLSLPRQEMREFATLATCESSGGRPKQILIVDESLTLAEAMKRILERQGFEVHVAKDAEKPLQSMTCDCFDVVLVSTDLPDGLGPKLLQRASLLEIPVILTSGLHSPAMAGEAIRHRASDYLIKPVRGEVLIRSVRRSIEEGQVHRIHSKLVASKVGGDQLLSDITGTRRHLSEALPQLHMVYQPIIQAKDGSVYAYEALLRCSHPVLNNPPKLLTAAELLGATFDVGRAVRAAVARTLLENQTFQGFIFVNIHPSEFHAGLLGDDNDPLLLFSERIVLEITERASLKPDDALLHELRCIRELGYSVAVDDLGEGYSGLSSLVHLHPDIAKIDMSLVRNVDSSPLKRDIIAALIDIAHNAGILIVAEGIETFAEQEALRALGVDLLQGYLFAKPSPPFVAPRADSWDG